MTTTPDFSQSARRASMFIILSHVIYNTGTTLCAAAMRVTAVIGDGFWRPVANHVSPSATQKLGSSCVAIAYLSVTITSSSIAIIGMLCAPRKSVTAGAPVARAAWVTDAGLSCEISTVVSSSNPSNFISRNTGAGASEMSWSVVVDGAKSSNTPISSKLLGRGKSPAISVAGF